MKKKSLDEILVKISILITIVGAVYRIPNREFVVIGFNLLAMIALILFSFWKRPLNDIVKGYKQVDVLVLSFISVISAYSVLR